MSAFRVMNVFTIPFQYRLLRGFQTLCKCALVKKEYQRKTNLHPRSAQD